MRIIVVTILLVTVLVWSVHQLPAMLHTVNGTSMYPALHHGQTIIVNPHAYRTTAPVVGDILVFRRPGVDSLLVKRVFAVADGSTYHVRGDNEPESLDSRHFGALPRDAIIGRVELLGRQRSR